jgi:protein SCO1/2
VKAFDRVTVAIAVVAFGAGALIAAKRTPEASAIASAVPQMKPFEGVRDIAAFKLSDHNGRDFDRDRLLGRWTLMTFGFTSCPDACPTMLTNLVELRKSLASDWRGNAPQFVFVSVDPARDTPALLAQYVPSFDAAFIGATGSQAAIDRLHADLGGAHRIAAKKHGQSGGEVDYTVDHSVLLYVINPDGRLHAQIAPPFDPVGVARQILRFAQGFEGARPAAATAADRG